MQFNSFYWHQSLQTCDRKIVNCSFMKGKHITISSIATSSFDDTELVRVSWLRMSKSSLITLTADFLLKVMKSCWEEPSGKSNHAILSSFFHPHLLLLLLIIRHKKDEFFLNRKRVQKSEVISLLESAGFSKSNPYYIVQQGKVANLCVMKDKERLELLKEVAGTTVYEERRAESIKITQETIIKQEQINVS